MKKVLQFSCIQEEKLFSTVDINFKVEMTISKISCLVSLRVFTSGAFFFASKFHVDNQSGLGGKNELMIFSIFLWAHISLIKLLIYITSF